MALPLYVDQLRKKTERVVSEFERHIPFKAAVLTGSVGEGSADQHSDVDLIFYYDSLPNKRLVRVALDVLEATNVCVHPTKRGVGFGTDFTFQGAIFNSGHQLVRFTEKVVGELLAGKHAESMPHQKIAQGLLHGIAIRGEGTIANWQKRLSKFPEELAIAMAEFYLGSVWPHWRVKEWIAARDARLFEMKSLVDGAFNIIGALSAANRLYFTNFQFKRMRSHIDAMKESPPGLAGRIENLFKTEPEIAAEELRKLVSETVEIVERLLSSADTSGVRKSL